MHKPKRVGKNAHNFLTRIVLVEKIKNSISHVHMAYQLLMNLENCKHIFTWYPKFPHVSPNMLMGHHINSFLEAYEAINNSLPFKRLFYDTQREIG